jgi:two-component system phosphate regulon sensor histidine kinase PhoR
MKEGAAPLPPSLLEALPAGVICLDAEGRVTAINQVLLSLLPLVQNPVGRLVREAMPIEGVVLALERALEGEAQEDAISVGRFDLALRAVPMPEGGVFGLVTNVTEALGAARARSNFAASVSHELRTPLTSILGYADTLLADTEKLPEDAVEMLEAIRRNTVRLGAMFTDLQHLYQLESREGDLPLEPTEVVALAGEVVEQHLDAARRLGIDLVLDAPVEALALLNREACMHILGNLVSNALKFTEQDGWVQVRVREEAEAIRVEVEDNGPGIDPGHHLRIFERFFRVDAGRTRKQGGSGLGLAIVKHLCQASGAQVGVQSQPGHGSTFVVRFPRP